MFASWRAGLFRRAAPGRPIPATMIGGGALRRGRVIRGRSLTQRINEWNSEQQKHQREPRGSGPIHDTLLLSLKRRCAPSYPMGVRPDNSTEPRDVQCEKMRLPLSKPARVARRNSEGAEVPPPTTKEEPECATCSFLRRCLDALVTD